MSAQDVRAGVVPAKWELAERLAGHANAPKQALGSIFKGIMSIIEEKTETTLDDSLKEKVWKKVSPGKLRSIKFHMLIEFTNKILGSFSESEATEMLEEHKQTGFIINDLYSRRFKSNYKEFFNEVVGSVMDKAKGMAESLVSEVFDVLEEEGIECLQSK